MKTLVVGATGATGRLLVKELLDRGQSVTAIVRSPESLSALTSNDNLSLVETSILDLSVEELAKHVADCDAVASCLGHNLSFRGIFGEPRRLVTEATRRLCQAIALNHPKQPVRFVLMNSAGNSNRDLHEPVSLGQRIVVGLLRVLVPPHADNEEAADYLRREVGQSDSEIEWVVVRPDSLIDEENVSKYEVHASPQRDAIFNPGKTSRIQVAHFMADLISKEAGWRQWKGKMPVIYSIEEKQN